MKPHYLKIAPPADSSINLFDQRVSYFATPWHYHPEYEIVLMLESSGKKYIGSNISDFAPDDLCMIGSLLPHFYKNPPEYYESNSTLRANSLVIHFTEESFGTTFWNMPEMASIGGLLERSKRGIQFGKKITEEIKPRIHDLFEKSAVKKILCLIDILNELSLSDDYKLLNVTSVELRNESDSDRIKKVYEYVIKHFSEEIRLQDVAQLANMSESAFSRYFKKRTRRTFSEFIIDIRIENACRQLVETDKNISEVAFESGFNNLSNFNRQFKLLKGMTPFLYKSTYHKTK